MTEPTFPSASGGVKRGLIRGHVWSHQDNPDVGPGKVSREGQKTRKVGVGRAAVYLAALPRGMTFPPPANPLKLAFRGGQIIPSRACLQVGQKLVVTSEDGSDFNLQTWFPKKLMRSSILIPDSKCFTETFSEPHEFVLLTCAIHVSAKAYLTVVPSPIFTLSREDGTFQLPQGLPPGRHLLRVYHPELGRTEYPVTIHETDDTVDVEITLGGDPLKAK